jgi:hypothetical protein
MLIDAALMLPEAKKGARKKRQQRLLFPNGFFFAQPCVKGDTTALIRARTSTQEVLLLHHAFY